MMEAEIRAMLLQAKEHQEVPVQPRGTRKKQGTPPPRGPEGARADGTWIWDF